MKKTLLLLFVFSLCYLVTYSQAKFDIAGDTNLGGKIELAYQVGQPGQILFIDQSGNPVWKYFHELIALNTESDLQVASAFDVGIGVYHSYYDESPGTVGINNVPIDKPKIRANVSEFDRITSTEYFMKDASFTSLNTINFDKINLAYATAKSNGKKIHAHALFFQQFMPSWLMGIVNDTNEPNRKTIFETQILYYISQVVGLKKAESYDVVNEIFAFNTFQLAANGNYYSKIDNYNTNISQIRSLYASDEDFLDFIVSCFTTAHAADPNAILFYNENDPEQLAIPASGESAQYGRLYAVLRLIDKLKQTSIPINKLGIGMQFHTNIYRNMAHLEYALNSMAGTGLKIHISELDVSVNYEEQVPISYNSGVSGSVKNINTISASLLDQQKQRYKDIVLAYKSIVPIGQAFGITVWDIGDSLSWFRHLNNPRLEWPTLYDENFNKKPSYFGFLEGLEE